MIRYLLDTNHASQFFHVGATLQQTIRRRREDEFGLCAPVIAELWFMVHNSHRVEQNRRDLQALLTQFIVWAFDGRATEAFGELKVRLGRSGRTVADVDLQIASIAITNNLILLTADAAFANVPGLKHEDWISGSAQSG